MKRSVLVGLVALLAFAPLPARATRLTRIIVHNMTMECMRIGVQEQGPHKAAEFGPLRIREAFDHIFAVPGEVEPNYFIEVALVRCGGGNVIYRDFYVTRNQALVSLQVVAHGSRYELKRWP